MRSFAIRATGRPRDCSLVAGKSPRAYGQWLDWVVGEKARLRRRALRELRRAAGRQLIGLESEEMSNGL